MVFTKSSLDKYVIFCTGREVLLRRVYSTAFDTPEAVLSGVLPQGCDCVQVLLGLAVFGVIILPGIFWLATRQAPAAVIVKFSRALVLAFGTSSTSAALPVCLQPPQG